MINQCTWKKVHKYTYRRSNKRNCNFTRDNENRPSEVRKGEKQVETGSKSTIKASQRKDRASGKMRRSRPRDKPSRRPSRSRDDGFRIERRSAKRRTERDHQMSKEVHMSTEPRWQSTTDFSLSHQRSNELQKGGMIISKMRPTD